LARHFQHSGRARSAPLSPNPGTLAPVFPASTHLIGRIPRPMNKADLVNLVAIRTEQTKTDVAQVVDALIDTIVDSVVEGKKVSILGFGSFERRERSARQGLNPKTGEKIKIEAKSVPAFTAGKLFKDRVQG
jgi:DNA-binding protein HU-beta